MSDNSTENLEGASPFERRVLRELAALHQELGILGGRLASLEDKVDARLRETRPIWEAVLARVEVVDSKLDVLGRDLLETRAETDLLKKRLTPAA
jgi:hypothetical protein